MDKRNKLPFSLFFFFKIKKRVEHLELVDLNMLNLVRIGFKYMSITSEACRRGTNFLFFLFSSFEIKKRVAYLELVGLNMLNLIRFLKI